MCGRCKRPPHTAGSVLSSPVGRITDTRERLIEAAITIIETDGEQGLRLSQVAEAVGIATPSIFHFFTDREDLIEAALAEMYWRVLAYGSGYTLSLAPSTTTAAEFEDLIRTSLAAVTDESFAHRRAMRTSVLGAAVNRPNLKARIVDMHRRNIHNLVEVIEIGRAKGFIQPAFDPTMIAMFFTSALTGRYYPEIDPDANLTEWDAILFETVRHLLFDNVPRIPPNPTSAP
jgi:TetR/AcrR family transcriptional regulator, cholesterol catabolism regulator